MAAGAAGVLYGSCSKPGSLLHGVIPGIKAFTEPYWAASGTFQEPMLGGMFIGLFESLGPSLFLDGLGIKAPIN